MANRIYDSRDHAYLKRLERERFELVAPVAVYYSMVRGGITIDPLYDEPVDVNHETHLTPFPVIAVFSQPSDSPEGKDEGLSRTREGEVYIARNEWDAKAPTGVYPKLGDIIQIADRFYNIVKDSTDEAKIIDSTDFVGYKLEVNRNSNFVPQRRV